VAVDITIHHWLQAFATAIGLRDSLRTEAMKLKEFQVTMYQSVLDSGVVDVGDVVCLVGKNEAGKTALLKALYKLNPIRPEDAAFSATDDYPRMEVSNYEESVAEGGTPDDAVAATYELSDSETEELSLLFGPSFLKSCSLRISKSYDNKRDFKSLLSGN
jgi:hypothetical protein